MDELITEAIIERMVEKKLINWTINLLQTFKDSLIKEGNSSIHPFCIDFASALLANLLHASGSIEFLETAPDLCK